MCDSNPMSNGYQILTRILCFILADKMKSSTAAPVYSTAILLMAAVSSANGMPPDWATRHRQKTLDVVRRAAAIAASSAAPPARVTRPR